MIAKISYVSDSDDEKIRFEEINSIEDLLDLHKKEKEQLIIDNWICEDSKADFNITILDDWID